MSTNALQDPSTIGNELVTLLTQQKRHYTQLQQLAEQQRTLIQAGQSEPLLSLLAQRQKIVNAIGKLHTQLAPHQQNWDAIKDHLDHECRGRIEGLLGDLQTMLNGLLEHDQKDCDELSTRKQQIANEMAAAGKGRVATTAYSANTSTKVRTGHSGGHFEVNG